MEIAKKYIWVVLTAFAFGTMEIALKIGGGDFTALQLTFLRFLIGGLFLLPFAVHDLKKRAYHLTKKDFGYLCLLGFFGSLLAIGRLLGVHMVVMLPGTDDLIAELVEHHLHLGFCSQAIDS